MAKIFSIVLVTLFISIGARASLFIKCETKENVTAEIQLKGTKGSVFIKKNGELAYFNYLETTYNEIWKSFTLNATQSNGQELNGAKFYFEMARGNSSASIRPYGLLTNRLFPGSEGIVVYGMTCDQDYQAIKNEIGNAN